MKKIIILLINLYKKYISPFTPPHCRYYPTCSSYAVEAISRFGVLRGGILAVKRILRCNRFFKGGFDPVPQTYPSKRFR
ncbi:membrane protein insertion efficiency factor YidD [[Clostridium] cellulosi]|nr:MAG: membrane protein insertion efficiency factor YidD [[Clostridium] cellulosi]